MDSYAKSTMTTTSHGLTVGQYFDIYSANGEKASTVKVTAKNGHTVSYRAIRWNERLWLWIKRQARKIWK